MEILASVLGGLVGGLFTFLGVLITILFERKKMKKEEERLQKEKEEERTKNRPRFEIIEHKKIQKYKKEDEDVCVLLCFIKGFEYLGRPSFIYDEEIADEDKLVCAEYLLKNTGNTEIDHLFLSTNLPRDTSLFNVLNEENKFCYKNKLLNYSVILDKSIKPQETIKVKICYVDKEVVVSNMGNPTVSFWMIDIDNCWWEQKLFSPDNKLYNSKRTTIKEWRNYTDIDVAIKCFINPMLW